MSLLQCSYLGEESHPSKILVVTKDEEFIHLKRILVF
jgi:hypothetical protein